MISIAPAVGLLPGKKKTEKSQAEFIKKFDKSFEWKSRLRVEDIETGDRMYIWYPKIHCSHKLMDRFSMGGCDYIVIQRVDRWN